MKLLSIFKNLLIESIKAGTFTGYHRTNIDDPKKFNKGFKSDSVRVGTYGPGLYMTYELEDQFKRGMAEKYGDTIVEFEIKNINKFLILDQAEAKKVYRYDISLIDQFKKILGGNFINFYKKNKERINYLNTFLKTNPKYTSESALTLSEIKNIEDYIDGIIFTGEDIYKVLFVMDVNIANPIRYTKDDGKTWINIKDKSSYKIGQDKRSISKEVEYFIKKDRFSLKDISKLSDEGKQELFDVLVNKYEYTDFGPELDNFIKYAKKEDIEKYIDNKLKDGIRMSDDEFDIANLRQKRQQIDKSIEDEESLTEKEFEYITPEQEKKYIIYRLKNKEPLQRGEYFDMMTDDQKKEYIQNMVDTDNIDYLDRDEKKWAKLNNIKIKNKKMKLLSIFKESLKESMKKNFIKK